MSAAAPVQTWSAATYGEHARFVADHGATILAWLAPQPGERILDLGCGDGALTVKLVEAGVEVVGVDASEDFVAAARELGIDARLGDGAALGFDHEFDAVFSNAALHWMTDAQAVADGVRGALRPGGRFVAEFGGHGNVAAIMTALHALAERFDVDPSLANPWYFPTPDEYRAVLGAAGFSVTRAELIPRQTPLRTGLRGWIKTFRAPFFEAAGERAEEAMDAMERLLAPALRNASGDWSADYVRLRVEAIAP